MIGAMPRKSAPKPDDPEQSKRFIDMAREVGADETEEGRKAFERAFDKVIDRPKKDPYSSGSKAPKPSLP